MVPVGDLPLPHFLRRKEGPGPLKVTDNQFWRLVEGLEMDGSSFWPGRTLQRSLPCQPGPRASQSGQRFLDTGVYPSEHLLADHGYFT
jgi:hypothetical protein